MANLESRRANLSAAQRALLARRLRGLEGSEVESAGSTALPSLETDETARYEPFALLDQQRLWELRGRVQAGHTTAIAYLEAGRDFDLERFEATFRQLITRHGMLRAVIRRDGRQQVLEKVSDYKIATLDLRGMASYLQEDEIKRLRERMIDRRQDADLWPLFEVRANRLDDGHTVVQVCFDLRVLDLPSLEFLFLEWRKLYEGKSLAPVELTFRDYVRTFERFRDTGLYQRSVDHWQKRLDALPPAPHLPMRIDEDGADDSRVTRYAWRLSKAEWDVIKERSAPHGLTPSVVLMAAFGEVLADFGESRHFSIASTLFLRQPFHKKVMEILGQFSSMSYAEVALDEPVTFLEFCQSLQQQLWKDLEHGFVNAEALKSDLLQQENLSEPAAPIVFTSALAHFEEAGDIPPTTWLGRQRHAINKLPNVWLENLALENAGTLLFHWDVCEGCFAAGLIREMFDAYCRRLHRLAAEETAWQETLEEPDAI